MTTYFFAKIINNILNPKYIFITKTNYYSNLFIRNRYIIDNLEFSTRLFPESPFHSSIVVTKNDKLQSHEQKAHYIFALLPTFIMRVEYKSDTVKPEKLFQLVS